MLLELADVRDSIALGLIAKSHEYTLLASESSFENLRQLVISMSMLRMQSRIIRAQLISGPGQYIESLLPGINAVMFPDESSSGAQLFAKTQSENPWLDIAFPAPTSNIIGV